MDTGEPMNDQQVLLQTVVGAMTRLQQLQAFQSAAAGREVFTIDEGSSESDRLIWTTGYLDGLRDMLRWLSDPQEWVADVETEGLSSSLTLLSQAVTYYRALVADYGSFDAAVQAPEAAVDWVGLFDPMQKALILGELYGLTFDQVDQVSVLLTDGWDDTYERLIQAVQKLSE